MRPRSVEDDGVSERPPNTSIVAVRTPEQFAAFHEIQVEYEATLPPDLQHDLAAPSALPAVYAGANAAYLGLVGEVPGATIAVVGLDAKTDVLQRLYVRPSFRNAGLARALVDAVIAHARERGCSRVVLDTDRDRMDVAYRLYRSFGFTESAPYGVARPGCATYMELELEP